MMSPAGPGRERVVTPVALDVPRTPLTELQWLTAWPGFLLHLVPAVAALISSPSAHSSSSFLL